MFQDFLILDFYKTGLQYGQIHIHALKDYELSKPHYSKKKRRLKKCFILSSYSHPAIPLFLCHISHSFVFQSCVMLKSLTDAFKQRDTAMQGNVRMGYEDFMTLSVLYKP